MGVGEKEGGTTHSSSAFLKDFLQWQGWRGKKGTDSSPLALYVAFWAPWA